MEQEVKKTNIISVKEWVINLIILIIPIVNIVFLFIWGFGQDDINETKKNWARASLILIAIGFGITILIYLLLAITGIALLGLGGNL